LARFTFIKNAPRFLRSAQLHGTYSALTSGSVDYALKDLTGGITTSIDTGKDAAFTVKVSQGKFVAELKEQIKSGIVGCCNFQPPPLDDESNTVTPEDRKGVLKGSCYAVTNLIENTEKRLVLVRITNPWGFGGFTGGEPPALLLLLRRTSHRVQL